MRLAEWRRTKGWTQADLAGALGCDISSIVRYEAGRTPVDGMKRKIFLVTGGAVQPNDHYRLETWFQSPDRDAA